MLSLKGSIAAEAGFKGRFDYRIMDIEEFRAFCLAFPGVEETFPFGEDTLVFKVIGKMFALTSLDHDVFSINLKCDPDRAIDLREQYSGIQPGYHMNKKHWNTVIMDGEIPGTLVKEMITDSYHLVVSALPLKIREALKA